ncbi:MAG: hypothetical protein M1820_003358 [Bogoriella megaspora]|nr:MAG: hypothetical protein M1820_003358 [Bogoriella megaspora]
MASLTKLPPELLYEIISYISASDMEKLRTMNTALRNSVEKDLYVRANRLATIDNPTRVFLLKYTGGGWILKKTSEKIENFNELYGATHDQNIRNLNGNRWYSVWEAFIRVNRLFLIRELFVHTTNCKRSARPRFEMTTAELENAVEALQVEVCFLGSDEEDTGELGKLQWLHEKCRKELERLYGMCMWGVPKPVD